MYFRYTEEKKNAFLNAPTCTSLAQYLRVHVTLMSEMLQNTFRKYIYSTVYQVDTHSQYMCAAVIGVAVQL